MLLGQGCLGSWRLEFLMGAGEGCKWGTVLPAHADWGCVAPIWDTGGDSNLKALFPPPLVLLGFPWLSTSRENSLERGGGFRTTSGGLAFGERWVNNLERKTGQGGGDRRLGVDVGPPSPSWCTYSDGDQLCFNHLVLWF